MLFNRYVQGNNKFILRINLRILNWDMQKFMWMGSLREVCTSQFSKDSTENYDKDSD